MSIGSVNRQPVHQHHQIKSEVSSRQDHGATLATKVQAWIQDTPELKKLANDIARSKYEEGFEEIQTLSDTQEALFGVLPQFLRQAKIKGSKSDIAKEVMRQLQVDSNENPKFMSSLIGAFEKTENSQRKQEAKIIERNLGNKGGPSGQIEENQPQGQKIQSKDLPRPETTSLFKRLVGLVRDHNNSTTDFTAHLNIEYDRTKLDPKITPGQDMDQEKLASQPAPRPPLSEEKGLLGPQRSSAPRDEIENDEFDHLPPLPNELPVPQKLNLEELIHGDVTLVDDSGEPLEYVEDKEDDDIEDLFGDYQGPGEGSPPTDEGFEPTQG